MQGTCTTAFQVLKIHFIVDNPTEWVSSDNKVYCPDGGGVDRPWRGQGGVLRPHRESGWGKSPQNESAAPDWHCLLQHDAGNR